MDGLAQIGSTLGDFVYAVLHPSVTNLPAGFLVLVFAVLMICALPQGAREKVRMASLAAFGLIVSLSLTGPLNWAAMLR
jgi:amino acid permease